MLVGGATAAWLGLRSRGSECSGRTVHGPVQIVPLRNQTGDAALDRAPTQLLQLLLAESPLLTVRQPAASDVLDGGTDGTAAQIKQGLSAPPAATNQQSAEMDLYTVSGFVSHSGDGYLLHLSARQAVDDSEVAAVEDTAGSVADLPSRMTRLVARLRTQMGESAASVSENVADVAAVTGNLPALNAVAEGDARAEGDDDAAALAAYSAAVREAPGFLPARLRLAAVLMRLHADREAALALDAIASSPAAGGPHLRAQRDYLLAQRGGGNEALITAERWHNTRPGDGEAQAAWTEQLLRAGRVTDAVAAAGVAVRLDPFRLRSRQLQTRAEIESGHPDAAWAAQTRAFAAGLGSPGLSLAAAVLKNDRAETESALSHVRTAKPNLALLLDDAVYLANMGDLSGASAEFDRAEAMARGIAGASSGAQYAAALQHWNLALAGNCPESLPGVPSVGEAAVLRWMTSAWCRLPMPAGAQQIHDPRMEAARLWLGGDEAGALTALNNVHAPEASLLRARLELLLGRPDAAISNARAVVEHRGTAYLSGGISYPAALGLLAAAYRSTGDEANAATEQAALREVWKNPVSTSRLLQTDANAVNRNARDVANHARR